MYDGSSMTYKNPQIMENEEIEIEYCPECGKYTWHKSEYGVTHEGVSTGKLVKYECLSCLDR